MDGFYLQEKFLISRFHDKNSLFYYSFDAI